MSDDKIIYEESDKTIQKIQKIIGLKKSRLILILTTVILFLTLILGLQIKINNSFITIDVVTDEVCFVLGTKFSNKPLKISDFDITGAKELSLEVRSVDVAQYNEDDDITWKNIINENTNILIEPTDPLWSLYVNSDNLVLEDLIIEDSSNVRISTANRNQVILNIGRGNTSVLLDTDDKLIVSCNSGRMQSDTQSFYVDGKQMKIEPEITQLKFEKNPFRNLLISFDQVIDFEVIEEFHNGKNLLVHTISFDKKLGEDDISSVVEESTLIYNDFPSKEYKIFPNEYLKLEGLRNFQLTEIHISNNISIRGTGYVNRAFIGNYLNIIDLTPTLIEWLIENEKVNLLIALLIPIASIVTAILYRMKVIDES